MTSFSLPIASLSLHCSHRALKVKWSDGHFPKFFGLFSSSHIRKNTFKAADKGCARPIRPHLQAPSGSGKWARRISWLLVSCLQCFSKFCCHPCHCPRPSSSSSNDSIIGVRAGKNGPHHPNPIQRQTKVGRVFFWGGVLLKKQVLALTIFLLTNLAS